MLNVIITKTGNGKFSAFSFFSIILLLISLSNTPVTAQTLNGDAYLTIQAEVDAFNYTEVTGSLWIQGWGITNLDGLSNLTSIGEFLEIKLCLSLTNLDGLSSLTSVGDYLFIEDNAVLPNIDGLSSLTSVGGDLQIRFNPALTDFCGLYPLLSGGLVGTYTVEYNALNPTQQDIIAGGPCPIVFNGDAELFTQAEVDAFHYTEVTGFLSIRDNRDITNLNGLSNLTSVGGDLIIFGNPLLTNLDGLSSLTSVGGYLEIQNNAALTNINGLSSLTSVGGGLYIVYNSLLTNLDGLFSLTSVGGGLYIGENSLLTNIDGLSNLTSVGGILSIQFNPALTNLDGLSSLSFVGGNLFIEHNGALTNLDGLYSLTSVGGILLSIQLNPALTNLDGLSSLISVGGSLAIASNFVLTEFCGLYTLLNESGLAGSYAVINNAVNPSVQDIIAGGPCVPLVVVCPLPQGYWKSNPWPVEELMLGSQTYSYTSLINILNMSVGTGNKADASLILVKQLIAAKLNIENGANASEAVQDAVDSADGLIGNSTVPMSVQTKTLLGKQMTEIAVFLESFNKGELNEGCTLAKSGNAESDELSQAMPTEYVLSQNYPNPFNPATTISWQLPVSGHVSLKVYDLLGKEVTSLVNENKEAGYYEVSFDASDLSSGIYIYRLTAQTVGGQAGNYISTKKMLLIK